MNIFVAKFGGKFPAALLALSLFAVCSLCFGCRSAQTQIVTAPHEAAAAPATSTGDSKNDAGKWIASDYNGIEPGKSTRADVIGRFGEPLWEGEEQLEGEDEDVRKQLAQNAGRRTMLEYKDVDGFAGKVVFFVGERDKIVQSIMFYPKRALSAERFAAKYGRQFVVLYAGEPTCAAIGDKNRAAANRSAATEENKMPQTLVYPGLGMYALLDGEGNIDAFGFSHKCAN